MKGTRWIYLLWLIFLVGLGVGCQPKPQQTDQQGRLLIWHNWQEPESTIIQELIHDYNLLYPDTQLILEYVPQLDIEAKFIDKAETGLGPDMLLGIQSPQLYQFVDGGYLLDLQAFDFDTTHIQQKAIHSLQINDELYGIPFSAFTGVLYYNKTQIDEPITTLNELINAARRGERAGISLDFFHAYWGIDAFNGALFRDNQVQPDQGFTDWLHWMEQAQTQPSLVFDSDHNELRDLFLSGEIDYFFGTSDDVPHIQSQFSAGQIGVAPLPAGTNPFPGAFLQVESLAVNKFSANIPLALDLITYLTNASNQRKISLSGLGRIPINNNVQLDPRIGETEATLLRQEQRAVLLPFASGAVQADLFPLGESLYLRVLQGVITPEDALVELTENFGEE